MANDHNEKDSSLKTNKQPQPKSGSKKTKNQNHSRAKKHSSSDM